MSRFRITVRGEGVELRGYIDGTEEELKAYAGYVDPWMMIASPAAGDYNPFEIDQPDYPPTEETSAEIIQGMWEDSDSPEMFMARIAHMHYMQATVIRGERGNRVAVEKELFSRELHHFETEQENERLNTEVARLNANEVLAQQMFGLLRRIVQARSNHPDLPVCEKHPDPEDFVKCGWRSAIEDIDKVLAEVPE